MGCDAGRLRLDVDRKFGNADAVEPTASLDAYNRSIVVELIHEKKQQRVAMVVIIHDDDIRSAVAGRIYGRLPQRPEKSDDDDADPLTNARVVLVDRVIERGWVAAVDGKIVEIGEGNAPERGEDMGRDLIMPGLIELLHLGRSVIVNFSRDIVAEAKARYHNVKVINITAPADILAARLSARERSTDGSLTQRLDRTVSAAGIEADLVIENIDTAEAGAAALLAFVQT